MTRIAVLILALSLAGGPVRAEEPLPMPSPEIVAESARQFLRSLLRLVDQIPMFEPPRVTAEGDIILRRIRPPSADDEEATAPREIGGVDL